jgi:PIN domain nuclease of toxin-antitoxin system
MRILLDTHTLLWYALDDPSLSAPARSLIIDPANDVLVSPSSYWKTAIKLSVGKLAHEDAIGEMLRKAYGAALAQATTLSRDLGGTATTDPIINVIISRLGT